MKQSQKLNATDLICWVFIDKENVVLTGHCNCMAGQGEVCSHVATLLFFAADLTNKVPTTESLSEVKKKKNKYLKTNQTLYIFQVSCTDVLSKWTVPPLPKKLAATK